jgi:D-beta-D-heptose 7-phosphate kinase/D-beta-D-heptose 1-phosphate adenosyltransferase
VFDVAGAGDTVISTLTLALSAGASAEQAAILANYAAAEVVKKLGVATVSRTEITAAINENESVKNPDQNIASS